MDIDSTNDTVDMSLAHDRVYGGGRVAKRRRESALTMICSSIGSITLTGSSSENIRGREATRGNSPAAITRSKSILKKTQVGSKVRFARCASSDPVMFDEANIMEVQTCLHPKSDDLGNTVPPTTPRSVVVLEEVDDHHADSEDPQQQYELMEVNDTPSAHIAKRGPHFYAEKVRQHEIEEGKLFCSSFKYHKPVDDDEKGYPISLSSPLLNGNHQAALGLKQFKSPLSQDSAQEDYPGGGINSPQSPVPLSTPVGLASLRNSFGAYEPGRLTSPLAFSETLQFGQDDSRMSPPYSTPGNCAATMGSANSSFTDADDSGCMVFTPSVFSSSGIGNDHVSERKNKVGFYFKSSPPRKTNIGVGSNLVGFCFTPPIGVQTDEQESDNCDVVRENISPFTFEPPTA